MKVGKLDKREVSELNHELFNQAKVIMENEHDNARTPTCDHMGWMQVGDFIDWLEANYNIKEKK